MSRPQGWSSLRNSRLLHVGVGCHQAENAPFPPLAEMLTAQPCQGVAEKVSRLQAPGNEGPGLAERGCRDFGRTAHAGVYYKHCADEIMAKALKLPTAVAGRKGTAPCQ